MVSSSALVYRKVASLRDVTSQRWLVGPLQRADLAAFLDRVGRHGGRDYNPCLMRVAPVRRAAIHAWPLVVALSLVGQAPIAVVP